MARIGAILGLLVALATVPQVASGTFSGVTANVPNSFVAATTNAPPTNVTAVLDCTGGSTTLNLNWAPAGWEDGFLVELYKPNLQPSNLVATWDFPTPGLSSVAVDITGFGNGRYEVVVNGYDATQTLPAVVVTFQKTGGCP